MNNERLAEDGLPRITKPTVDVLLRDLQQRHKEGHGSFAKFIMPIMDRIHQSNPDFQYFFNQFTDDIAKKSNLEDAISAGTGFYLCYELLRRQIESYTPVHK